MKDVIVTGEAVAAIAAAKRTNLTFREAFALLKAGECVRRAEWLGYWVADGENVLMHCKDGRVFDMSKGCVPMFTLSNALAEDWMLVDEAHRAELDRIHASKMLAPAADQAKAERILAEDGKAGSPA